jgi:hypothetical protein
MKGVIITNLAISNKKNSFFRLFYNYFFIPFKSGLFGFAIFFTALLLVKTFLFLISSQNYFIVNVGDVVLSLIGFASLYVVRIFQNIKNGK